jgi:lycopene cyclase domain-containing protein
MSYLYLLLNLGSLIIPLIFSFHPKLKFYKYWKSFFIAILISSAIFIIWDIIFTKNAIWGFNETYLVGINVVSLPIEEWLFFLCIPYACIFTHYSLIICYPNLGLNKNITNYIAIGLIILFLLVAVFNIDKNYTFINFAVAGIVLTLVLLSNKKLLQQYFLTYLAIFIPFLLINGILTGSLIENEVVWYNDAENLGMRIFTIPIEDAVYAFSLMLIPLSIMKRIES